MTWLPFPREASSLHESPLTLAATLIFLINSTPFIKTIIGHNCPIVKLNQPAEPGQIKIFNLDAAGKRSVDEQHRPGCLKHAWTRGRCYRMFPWIISRPMLIMTCGNCHRLRILSLFAHYRVVRKGGLPHCLVHLSIDWPHLGTDPPLRQEQRMARIGQQFTQFASP